MNVIDEIAAERARQTNAEGWSPEHDAEHHADGSLALAAALYATPIDLFRIEATPRSLRAIDAWPWKRTRYAAGRGDDYADLSYQENDGDKRARHDRRRRLVIAAALIVAEIERLDRAAPAPASAEGSIQGNKQ